MALVEFPLEGGGGAVLVRIVDKHTGGTVLREGRGTDALERAANTFETALSTIRVVAQGVFLQLSDLARSPDEVNIDFGLEAGAVRASAELVAQLKVRLTWRPPTVAGSADGRG